MGPSVRRAGSGHSEIIYVFLDQVEFIIIQNTITQFEYSSAQAVIDQIFSLGI